MQVVGNGTAEADRDVRIEIGERSLGAFLRTGAFPGGVRADLSMPVYEISDSDLADLIAYLKRVGEVSDAGLSDSAIEMATILPAQGTLGELGTVLGF